MNVTIDHQIFLLQRFGGISRYFISLYRELLAMTGIAPTLYAPISLNHYLNSFSSRTHIRLPRVLHSPPVQNILIKTLPIFSPLTFPNIIHLTYYYTHWSAQSLLAKKPVPTILTVYDLIDEFFYSGHSTHAAMLRRKKKAIVTADHLIAISNNTKSDIVNYYGVDPTRISVTHLAPADFSTIPSLAPSVSLPENFVLYVGPRKAYKNFNTLVNGFSCSQLCRHKFSLIAFGGEDITPDELRLLEPLLSRRQFLHIQGGDSILKYLYQRAFALVYPSLYEGFGLPPLEAMSLGCPVISSKTSSLSEVLGSNALLFDPYTMDSLVSSLDQLFHSSALRESLSVTGRIHSRSYSWSATAQSTVKAYKNIL